MAAVALTAFAAHAQDTRWMEQLPGFSSFKPLFQPSPGDRPRGERKPAPQNDLRTGDQPLRSEAALTGLERARGQLARIVAGGGWKPIPGTRMLRPGDDDERIPLVRRRLVMEGELSGGSGFQSMNFDGHMEVAVRRFQTRYGLRVTGRIDRPTLQALNVPAAARLAQLDVNIRRIRALLDLKTEDRYVLVNVPSFELEAVDRHRVEQRHRVIAGKPDRQTPVVTATIKALNFFPYWKVPESVATLDLIPRLLKEPEYLQKEQIRVLKDNYIGQEIDATAINWAQVDATKIRFRQDPGERNALGLVRIDMPNEHGVYMHDTPMKPLFQQRGRAYSAGCVRVQDVMELAAWLGRDEPGFDRRRIDEILQAGQAQDINLTRPVPVHFVYITAWAEADGRLQFRPDIYGQDQLRELASDREHDPEAPPPPRTLAP